MIKSADRLEHVGEYFFSQKLREIQALRQQGIDVINLGVGSPDMMPPKVVIDAVQLCSKQEDSHGYQSYTGLPELRQAISSFYKRNYQVALDPSNQILPMMGSKEAIMHISMTYLNKADQVLIPALGYPTYTSVTKLLECDPIFYPLQEDKNWEPDWQFFESLDWRRIKLIWLNYPHMPTGAKGTREIFEKFVQLAKKNEVLVCHDNPYSFVLNQNPLSIFNIDGAKEVAIELNSLSKTFNMAGWRVGWVSGSADVISNILKVKSNMDSGMFKPIQYGAIAALNAYNSCLDENNLEYAFRQKLAFQILELCKANFEAEQSGMFVWGRIKDTGAVFSDSLLKETGVFLTPGFIFGDQGKHFIRISLCVTQERLKEAIQRLKKYLI
jgi:LL-diaminopimelate aminotransferase